MELDLIEYDIDPNVKRQVENVLQNFLTKTSAKVVILADDAGRIVSIKGGYYEETETDFLATLISGIFGAAVEMGKILKMEDLEVLQYESKSMDVIIKYIPPRFLLGVIVGEEVALGTVRLFLKDAGEALEKILAGAKMVPVREIKIDVNELEKKLSRILGGNQ
ncbi:MAG: roadblock/LC7 domain-containing protein [Aquificaceae bacterium]